MYLRRHDIVLVLKGKDRLKTGKILRVNREANRIVVEGVALVKRHKKSQCNVPGGILTSESSISAANVRLIERPDTAGMTGAKLPGRVLKRMKGALATAPKKTASAKKATANAS